MKSAVPRLPPSHPDQATHNRRLAETVNNILGFQHDDSRIRTPAEALAGVTPVNYAYAPGNIRRYGAVVDGSTDDSDAIRSALNAVPLNGGRIFCEPPGSIMVKSVIYIPQRNSNSGTAQGTTLDFTGCTINGNGGSIFESGTGQYSTVAKGGATNWGLGNELSTTIHNADKIVGATFTNYSTALKLFNFIAGCKLKDLYSESTGTLVQSDRSFYLQWDNVIANCSGQPSTVPIIEFGAEVNTMTFLNVHVAGGSAGTGIGYQFNGAVKGLVMGLGAEDLTIGYDFLGEILGLQFTGNYSEGCTTAISLGSSSDALNIEGNYFNSNTTVITGNNWLSGRWGLNHYDTDGVRLNAVALSGTGNLCEVWIPPRQFTQQGGGNPVSNWTQLPAHWAVNPGCKLRYQDYIYNDTTGFNAALAWLEPTAGGDGQLAKCYIGKPNTTHSGQVPFCTTTVAGTTVTVDTKISFDANAGGIEFDMVIADNIATRYVSGRVFGGTSVFRYDALGSITVTVSNNGGMFRFVFAGFSVAASLVGGEIRII